MKKIAVAPDTRPAMYTAFAAAVVDAGAEVADLAEADALMWADPAQAAAFPSIIAGAPNVRWIQLPYAGIEPFAGYLDARYTWTCGKGVYAPPVAEHVLALMLAGARALHTYARADRWREPIGRNLHRADVLVLGGGGICESLLSLLAPFECSVTVYRKHRTPIGEARVITTVGELRPALHRADFVVVALALTPETQGLIDATMLGYMRPTSWIINVGRGGHIVTYDLVDALREGRIGGAALDVTDPEPLPEGHPLWSLSNCIITPHIGNTPEMGLPLIATRVGENVARYVAGEPLIGTVDVALGY